MVADRSWPLDTDAQVAEATQALCDADLDQAWIYVGDPGCPDSYRTDRRFLADLPAEAI